MDIVIAAEKPSIAQLLSEHTRKPIDPEDIEITENPAETGSFYIGWHFDQFLLSPNGVIVDESLGRGRNHSRFGRPIDPAISVPSSSVPGTGISPATNRGARTRPDP